MINQVLTPQNTKGLKVKIYNENNELLGYCLSYDPKTREAEQVVMVDKSTNPPRFLAKDGKLVTQKIPNCRAEVCDKIIE